MSFRTVPSNSIFDSPNTTMSSAYAKRDERPSTSIFLVSLHISYDFFKCWMKRAGDNTSPFFNPHLTSNSFDVSPRKRTLQSVSELQHFINLTNFFGIPKCISADHSWSLIMLSQACWKSMKIMCRSLSYS